MALASLEEIDAEAWFSGNKTKQSLESVDEAIGFLEHSQESFSVARSRCAAYREWFPAERREEVTPDITYFNDMVGRLGKVLDTLRRREAVSLQDIHGISAAMRNEMIVGERKGLAHRGTRHHFPAGHE